MTPAVRNALAYIHLTNNRPSRTHFRTNMAVIDMTDFNIIDHKAIYTVKEEYRAAVEGHAMVKAARWLEAQGFKLDTETWRRPRTSSRYIPYRKIDEDGNAIEASAFRSGTASIRYGQTIKNFQSDRLNNTKGD